MLNNIIRIVLDLRGRSGRYQRIQLENDAGQAVGGRKILLARVVGKRKVSYLTIIGKIRLSNIYYITSYCMKNSN